MKKLTFSLLAACGVLAVGASHAHAQSYYGLVTGGTTIATYSTATSTPTVAAVTGLGADTLRGIDVFASVNNQLYGFGASGTLYSLAQSGTTFTATINAVSSPTIANASAIDFNPMANRLRIFQGTNNFRLTPGTGTGAPTQSGDGTLAYAGTDANAASTPALFGAAYTNNFASPASTALYGIDTTLDTLVMNTVAPTFNVVNTVGPLGVNVVAGTTGFDIQTIGTTNTAYLTNGNALYTVNLTTGAATSVGTLPGAGIIDLAVVPEPSTYVLFAVGALALGVVALRRRQAVA